MAEPTPTPQPQAGFRLIGHFTRDLSFESTVPPFAAPKLHDMQMDVGINVKKTTAKDGEKELPLHEVSLFLKGRALEPGDTKAAKPLFIVEIEFVGIFEVKGLQDIQITQFLATDGATLIYPFARHVLMSTVADGGWRPPLLEPINFHGMFQQAQQANQPAAVIN